MKKILIAFVLLFLSAAPALADVVQEESALLNQLESHRTEYDKIAKERTRLSQRFDDLTWAQGQISKQVTAFKTKRADLDIRLSTQLGIIDDHSSRCGGTFSDESYVNACNSQGDRINAVSDSLNQENEALNKTQSLLAAAIKTQTEETEKVIAAEDAAVSRQNELVALEEKIISRLSEINVELEACKTAIGRVDANPNNQAYKEIMHARCGSMFDGNR